MSDRMIEALKALKDSQTVSGTVRQAGATEEAIRKVDRAAQGK